MGITTYQINNVLKVYANQLQQSRFANISKSDNSRSPDTVNISAGAKKKAIADKVASSIIEKITQYGTNNDIEKEVFQKLESEYEAKLSLSKEEQTHFKYREIDENGETIKNLSIEDSKNLIEKLKKKAEDTGLNNMI
jgi:hypothetical protein